MNVDGEQEEEEDAGWKRRVKLSAGPVGKGKERAVGSDKEEKEMSRKSSVMGKGKSERKQADHVEDGNAILEYNSYPSIIDLLQMHLHFRVLTRNSRVPPLFLNVSIYAPPKPPSSPPSLSYPSSSSPSPGTAAMTSNPPDRIMENPSERSAPQSAELRRGRAIHGVPAGGHHTRVEVRAAVTA